MAAIQQNTVEQIGKLELHRKNGVDDVLSIHFADGRAVDVELDGYASLRLERAFTNIHAIRGDIR